MLTDAVRQVAGLRRREHRPWPLPHRPWVMGQTWRDLLFAHWRIEPRRLRSVIPPEIPLDEFDGSCWVGVTPFEVSGLRLVGTPPLPRLSRFPELNVRTYTTIDGRPGIWFMSLDAARVPAVLAARRGYRLPYFHADMAIGRGDTGIDYSSRRDSPDSPSVEFAGHYAPTGPPAPAAPGALEHFLVERYCLYALDDQRRVLRADIHHPPWPVQPARASIAINTMGRPYGLALDEPPLVHYAARNDVLIWPERRVG